MRPTRIVASSVLAVAIALLAFACSGDGSDPVSGQGTLTIAVHDQAALSLTRADVTFSSVEAHVVGGDWIAAQGAFPRTVDLMQFTSPDDSAPIVQDLVPVGTYDRLRVGITAVHLEFSDGSEADIPVPSGGVQLAIPVSFTVTEGGQTEVSLDFAPNAVFKPAGSGWTFDGSGVSISRVR